jgi:alkanesulfonate monooxygenase SsuD/methylene tetrahydromethanopterin reductase-like flavin-dependent oxidoreductase (luciferase family)
MKVSIFNPMKYQGRGLPFGWPTPPGRWDPETGADSIAKGFELFDVASEYGFDWLTVAEHHYSRAQLAPSPVVMAAAVSQRYPNAKIAVLGVVLPLTNPVRTAEEIAILDAVSGGRTIVGFFRGIPNEFLTYGTNPSESRAMYEEALELVQRAWSEPEPFGWEGRHYRFRTVAVWPQPLQKPRMPMVLAGTSPESARFAARQKAILGLSFLNTVETGAELVRLYREEAAATGWEPTREDVLFRARVYVAETDEQAEAEAREYEVGDVLGPLVPPPEKQPANQKILGAVFGPSGFAHHPPGPGTPPEYCGSPETVARQIREAADAIGYGVADLIFTADRMPHEKAVRSVELFGKEVLPLLRAA